MQRTVGTTQEGLDARKQEETLAVRDDLEEDEEERFPCQARGPHYGSSMKGSLTLYWYLSQPYG